MDSWTETAIQNQETAEITIEDSFVGEENMEEVEEEKYLGDIISKDGKNIKNFKVRVNKGTGIVNKIMTMLDGIPFGQFYFEVALILRNSLLVSSMLCNSEAWYNITNTELNLLETIDLRLLRKIMHLSPLQKRCFIWNLGVFHSEILFNRGDSHSCIISCMKTQSL